MKIVTTLPFCAVNWVTWHDVSSVWLYATTHEQAWLSAPRSRADTSNGNWAITIKMSEQAELTIVENWQPEKEAPATKTYPQELDVKVLSNTPKRSPLKFFFKNGWSKHPKSTVADQQLQEYIVAISNDNKGRAMHLYRLHVISTFEVKWLELIQWDVSCCILMDISIGWRSILVIIQTIG